MLYAIFKIVLYIIAEFLKGLIGIIDDLCQPIPLGTIIMTLVAFVIWISNRDN